MSTEITITIPASEAAQRHIENLQATLTKRNAEIGVLRERVEEALTGEPNQTALAASYKRGWQDAAHRLASATHTAARELGLLRKDALEIYLQAERRDSAPEATE